MANNIVYRTCLKCHFESCKERDFYYMGNEVWKCTVCLSMYTHVSKIIDPDRLIDPNKIPIE